MAKAKQIIAMSAPVAIEAAASDGEKKSPAKFVSTFYTGGALSIAGWDMPVVVDLAGLTNGKVLVANLDHDSSKRVGNFTVANDGKSLVANGSATASTPARDEVVNSAADGYQWQASLEVSPTRVEEVKAGKKVEVNGQSFEGPLYVTRAGVLKGFAFVSHGADDNTTATIAASAANNKKEIEMDKEVKAWAEAMGVDVDNLTAEQQANIVANYNGKNGKKPAVKAAADPFEARKLEAQRRTEIKEYADLMAAKRPGDVEWVEAIEKMHDHAIETNMGVQAFRLELQEAMTPAGFSVVTPRTRDSGVTNRVLEAAVCMAGQMSDDDLIKKHRFTDQELQTAHDKFKGRIGLKQLFFVAAEANGYRSNFSSEITPEVQNAAFGYAGPRQIHGSGFSTLSISTILSNVANKFMRDGFNSVDQTCLRIAAIRSVNDFKTITTTSLTDGVIFEKVGPAGEIKHGTLGELTYSNKADTYAKMLAITRTDYINDDLGALTLVPRKLGNGSMKKLNDIFWTEFLALVGDSFFASGNANLNAAVADMTIGGLTATETIFMNQTNPDGTPLGLQPAILLVPTALKAAAITLMTSERIVTGSDVTKADGNPYRGRFQVESSPYISNTSYTGYTSAGWWMLANPSDCPVIEIAALNGRIEPTVETADAEFNVLGVQMRGYSDVGVKRQEYRGGVYADGGTS